MIVSNSPRTETFMKTGPHGAPSAAAAAEQAKILTFGWRMSKHGNFRE